MVRGHWGRLQRWRRHVAVLSAASLLVVLAPGSAAVEADSEPLLASLTPPVGTTDSAGTVAFVEPMEQVVSLTVRGGVVTQGSPIAGDFNGADNILGNADDGTSTQIALTVPGTSVKLARLYWTVLTNSGGASNRAQNIIFDGQPVSGTLVGFSPGRTPCFPQDNTFAWTADVTGLVTTGPATHTVAGLPGGNQIAGADFAEGASLLVVFGDPSQPTTQVVIYEGLAVTNAGGDTLTQTLTGFRANTTGSFSAEWFPIVGNGQQASETLTFTGSLGSLDFSNDVLLDGSTSMFPRNGASYTDSGQVDVFWDDDSPDVSAVIGHGSNSATVDYTLTGDCHTFVAMWLTVTRGSSRLPRLPGPRSFCSDNPIAFGSQRDGNQEIYVMDVDGGARSVSHRILLKMTATRGGHRWVTALRSHLIETETGKST